MVCYGVANEVLSFTISKIDKVLYRLENPVFQSAGLFLSGSRCSAAAGNSCPSSEDETCISGRQDTRNEVQHSRTPSALVPKTSVKVGSLISGDAVKAVICHNDAPDDIRGKAFSRHAHNPGYEPDRVTYGIVMEVLGHCCYLTEAEAVFYEMPLKNWVPDEHIYGLVVDLWGIIALRIQKRLGSGMYPKMPTCNSLLSTFLGVRTLAGGCT
ncbi:unnamed protein product [Ilex paraguariensis]|uniref:Pentatricopeptide repeat-containing protein n=1 Tax=Ilex paraguariensis TaxID=185542 RepID=A0ABC8UUK4_9AQUA